MGFKNCIRLFALTALLASLAVGCGDGKRMKRQAVPKNAANQKIDPKTGKPVTPAPGPGGPKDAKPSEEAKKQEEAKKEFDGRIQQLQSGQLMEKSALPDGTYKLNLITTAYKYLPGANWVYAYRAQALTLDSANFPVLSEEPSVGIGVDPKDSDKVREVEIPMSFDVAKEANVFRAERSSFRGFVILRTRVAMDSKKVSDTKPMLVNEVSGLKGNQVTVPASVAELLAKNHISPDGSNGKDLKYTLDDGKTPIDLRIYKLEETKYRLTIEIMESPDPVRMRVIGLDYELKPKKASSPGGSNEGEGWTDNSDQPRPEGTESGEG